MRDLLSHEPYIPSFTCDVTHSIDMTPSRVTWLIHEWHDPFTCALTHIHVTWCIHVWHDSFTCGKSHACVASLIYPFSTHEYMDMREIWTGDVNTCICAEDINDTKNQKVARHYTRNNSCVLIHTSACLPGKGYGPPSLKATCMLPHLHPVCHLRTPMRPVFQRNSPACHKQRHACHLIWAPCAITRAVLLLKTALLLIKRIPYLTADLCAIR